MAAKGGRGIMFSENTKERRGLKMENPFTLKAGQVFTGFGIGCGIGIGVGRPLNLGAIPVLNQVMSATRGATDAFTGVQRHVNSSLKKVGAKNIEVGIGCGVGFGHGFGVGLAVKTSVLHQFQSQFLILAIHVMKKLGIDSSSTLPVNQGIIPASLQTGKNVGNEPSPGYHTGVISKLVTPGSNGTLNGNVRDERTLASSVEPLVPKSAEVNTEYSNLLKNPLFKEDGAVQLQNNVLQTVLKHQVLIEELMQENEKLHQILLEELKIQPSRFKSRFTSRSQTSCTDCFECRRKQRRR